MEITMQMLTDMIEYESKRYHSIRPGLIGSTSTRESRPLIIGRIQILNELIEVSNKINTEAKKIDKG